MRKAFAVGCGIAALLWLTLGSPVLSHQSAPLIPSRMQTVEAINSALTATLVASGENPILDVGNAAFVSHTVGNIAWIPLDYREWTEDRIDLLDSILRGQPSSVTVGILAVGDDLAVFAPGEPQNTFMLPAGTYVAKVRWDAERQEPVGVLVGLNNQEIITRLLIVREETQNTVEWHPLLPYFHTEQIDDQRFLITVGSEPLSQYLEQLKAKLSAPPNPIVIGIAIQITIRVTVQLTARQVIVGGGLIGCLLGGCPPTGGGGNGEEGEKGNDNGDDDDDKE